MQWSCLFIWTLAAGLTACGGADPDAPITEEPPTLPTPAPAVAPLIRFKANYYVNAAPPLPERYLTVSPIDGETSISARPIASIELYMGDAQHAFLTQSNATTSDGRASYFFQVPAFIASKDADNCNSLLPTAITVTDVHGFRFIGSYQFCKPLAHEQGFFSNE